MDRRKGEELLEVKRWEKKSPNTSRRAIFIANNYPLNRKKIEEMWTFYLFDTLLAI